MRPVRVGYCIDSFDIGGTELNAVRTLEALDRKRFRVTVFHLHGTGPLRSRYDSLGVELMHLRIGSLYSPRTVAQGLRFLRTLHSQGIEVVHTHDVYTNIFATPWAWLGGCRIVASRRWLDEVPRRGLATLNRWSYRFVDRVVVNSALSSQVLVDSESVPATRIIELPNFVEERAFQHVSAEVRSARRHSWGIPPGAFVIGTVARLVPVKNHSMLLHALSCLDERIHGVIIGEGPARAALEALARSLHVETRVHFIGQLLEVTNLHQFLDASVLCSRSEGFPNSVIEALAAGCPVVATPVGGIPEVINHGRTGMLVPVDDPQGLAAAIEKLHRDKDLYRRLSESGLACVRAKYHQSAVISRLEGLYQQLAEAGGGAIART